MAGDWIKLEHTTPDKPEVYAIAAELGIPQEHVLGCLLRVWLWVDQQSLNGNGLNVSKVTLGNVARHAGFGEAMQKVGWLVEQDGLLSFPNFDRHNGQTAKNRVLTAQRVANYKKRQGNGVVTPSELPKEEKIRVTTGGSSTTGSFESSLPNLTPVATATSEAFEAFWRAYPRKVSKGDAEKAWAKAKVDQDLRVRIMAKLNLLKKSPQWLKEGGQFVPYPASWLNAKGWEDEVEEAPPKPMSKQMQGIMALERMKRGENPYSPEPMVQGRDIDGTATVVQPEPSRLASG